MGPKGEPLIPPQVLGMVSDSEVLADVIFTIGNDPAELAKFVETARKNPNAAMRYVAKVESLIEAELLAELQAVGRSWCCRVAPRAVSFTV